MISFDDFREFIAVASLLLMMVLGVLTVIVATIAALGAAVGMFVGVAAQVLKWFGVV